MHLTHLTAMSISLLAASLHAASDWATLPDLLTSRSGVGAAVDPFGQIYAIGGHHKPNCGDSGTTIASVEVFNGTSWTFGPDLNVPRHHGAVVQSAGFIYAIGGATGSGSTAICERLDTLDPSAVWDIEAVPPLPIPLFAPGATVDSAGRVWVVGGQHGASESAACFVFDPARAELGWVEGPPLTHARHSLGFVCASDGFLYAIGGTSYGAHRTVVERIDPIHSPDQWEQLQDIPYAPSEQGYAVAGADGRIYLPGGWLPGCTDRTLRFDPRDGNWDVMSARLSLARSNIAVAIDEQGRIICIGGDCCESYSRVEALDTQPCPADFNADGAVNTLDFIAFLNTWAAGCP